MVIVLSEYRVKRGICKSNSLNFYRKRVATEVCGSTRTIQQLIIGGVEKEIEDWPWLAALLEKKSIVQRNKNVEKLVYFCGGSLINFHLVVTAAHCIVRKKPQNRIELLKARNLVVSLGSTDPHNIELGQQVNVESLHLHPSFNAESLNNDIAILNVDSVVYNNAIVPVCLTRVRISTGADAKIVGRGENGDDYSNSNALREAKVKAISNQECINKHRKFVNFIWENNFCAKGVSGSACGGDSGSGLYKSRKEKWVLSGIVSFKANGECEKQKAVSVFTDVSKYFNWIVKIAKETS